MKVISGYKLVGITTFTKDNMHIHVHVYNSIVPITGFWQSDEIQLLDCFKKLSLLPLSLRTDQVINYNEYNYSVTYLDSSTL